MRAAAQIIMLLLGMAVAHAETPFQLSKEWQKHELAAILQAMVMDDLGPKCRLERPSQKVGPQFFYTFNEEQLFTAEQALTNPRAVPPDDKWLGSSAETWDRQECLVAKLRGMHSPTITWGNGQTLRHLDFTLGQQIMLGMALSRYHCTMTHSGSVLRFNGQELVLPENQEWGEDGSLDENEDLNQFSPEICEYYNGRSEALFKVIENPKVNTFGGVSWYTVQKPWWLLEFAVRVIQGSKW